MMEDMLDGSVVVIILWPVSPGAIPCYIEAPLHWAGRSLMLLIKNSECMTQGSLRSSPLSETELQCVVEHLFSLWALVFPVGRVDR